MLELFLNAYQGWRWNEITIELLKDLGRADLTASYGFGKLVFYEKLSAADWRYLGRLVIPAPAPKAEFSSERTTKKVFGSGFPRLWQEWQRGLVKEVDSMLESAQR